MQQPSDKGNDVHLYKTLKQGCATHGSRAKVTRDLKFCGLWPAKGQIFKQAFGMVLPGPD